MKVPAILSAGLLLLGCENPIRREASHALDLADAAQANARTALSQNEDQSREIRDLESKIRVLESELSSLQETVGSNARTANDNAKLMDRRWEAYKTHTH